MSDTTNFLTHNLVVSDSPKNTINGVASDQSKGAYVGAQIGSVGGPVGAAIGGVSGAAIGTLGNALGYGHESYKGRDQKGGWGTQNPGTLMDVSQQQYNNYGDAANYLNAVNNAYNTGVGDVGSSAWGNKNWSTKQIIGSDKRSSPYWQVGANTGYNVLDDYTNNSLGNWEQYANDMSSAYGNKLSGGIDRLSNPYKDNLNSQYGLGAVGKTVNNVNAQQRAEAEQLLANMYNAGDISGAALQSAWNNLDRQDYGNKKNLYDIANAQNNAWADMMGQMIAADKDAQNKEDDWILNYDKWNKYAGGNVMDLLNGTSDRANTYANNFINDAYYNALLNQGNSYLPHNALAQAYADETVDNEIPLQAWSDLLLSNRKRKANNVGVQEWQ